MEQTYESAAPGQEPDAIQRYAELVVRSRRIEAELKALSEELATLEKPIQNLLLERGIQKATINTGGHAVTVFQRRQIWATVREGFTKEQAIAALEKNDTTASFVKKGYNSQTLSAYVREELASNRGLPEVFQEGQPLDVVEKITVEHRVGTIRETDGAAASRALRESRQA